MGGASQDSSKGWVGLGMQEGCDEGMDDVLKRTWALCVCLGRSLNRRGTRGVWGSYLEQYYLGTIARVACLRERDRVDKGDKAVFSDGATVVRGRYRVRCEARVNGECHEKVLVKLAK